MWSGFGEGGVCASLLLLHKNLHQAASLKDVDRSRGIITLDSGKNILDSKCLITERSLAHPC